MVKSKTVQVLIPETHPVLKETPKQTLGITFSDNALPSDDTEFNQVKDFKSALKLVNHEVRIFVKLPNGKEVERDYQFQSARDLEADALVPSNKIHEAGALYKIPETKEMLMRKAVLRDLLDNLKRDSNRRTLAHFLRDEKEKTQLVQKLRQKANEIKSITIK